MGFVAASSQDDEVAVSDAFVDCSHFVCVKAACDVPYGGGVALLIIKVIDSLEVDAVSDAAGHGSVGGPGGPGDLEGELGGFVACVDADDEALGRYGLIAEVPFDVGYVVERNAEHAGDAEIVIEGGAALEVDADYGKLMESVGKEYAEEAVA